MKKLAPINRTRKEWWEEENEKMIKESKYIPTTLYGVVPINKNSALVKVLDKVIKEAKECFVHKLNYVYYNYRLYRRGKNRCTRCGVKLR